MPKYTGQTCTSCHRVFNDDDDIVVCPECGTPYHRECYKHEGKCINTELHESGESWKPVSQFSDGFDAQTERVCQNCGEHNAPNAVFCSRCRTPLVGAPDTENERSNENGTYYDNRRTYVPPFGQGMPGGQFVNVRTVAADTDIDGNTIAEYSQYVGTKSYAYVPHFLRFAKTGTKFSFNIFACFMPQYWYFYRKLYKAGALFFAVEFLLAIPSMLSTMNSLFEQNLGTVPFAFVDSMGFVRLQMIAGLLNYVVMFTSGMLANWLYYRKAKSDIDGIKAVHNDPESRKTAIFAAGGTSIAALALAFGLTFLLSAIMTYGVMLFGM